MRQHSHLLNNSAMNGPCQNHQWLAETLNHVETRAARGPALALALTLSL